MARGPLRPFFVSSEQDDEETPWSAEIDKKLLCPKELIHKTKTDGLQGNKTGTQGPKSKLNNLYLTPELFAANCFWEGVWSMSDVDGIS